MSKVLTFSQVFPAYHPSKGEPTFFKEKIWAGLADITEGFKIPDHCVDWDWHEYYNGIPKYHTIRAGNRWKVGDKFSPRVWSGKPYQSKQIIIAPDIEVKKVWEIFSDGILWWVNHQPFITDNQRVLAENDGLDYGDFLNWFKYKPFSGQIICWNDRINY